MAKKLPNNARTFLKGINGEIDRAVENELFTDWVFLGVSPDPADPFLAIIKIYSSNPFACHRFLSEAAEMLEDPFDIEPSPDKPIIDDDFDEGTDL